MKQITYICDRCKMQDTDNKIELISVKIVLSSHNDSGFHSTVKQADWCRKCLASYGFVGITEDTEPPVIKIVPPQTLEDIVKEIIREELEQ